MKFNRRLRWYKISERFHLAVVVKNNAEITIKIAIDLLYSTRFTQSIMHFNDVISPSSNTSLLTNNNAVKDEWLHTNAPTITQICHIRNKRLISFLQML